MKLTFPSGQSIRKFCLLLLGYLLWTSTVSAQISPSADKILYVNKAVAGGNGSGDSWVNAVPELADALRWARQQHDADNNWLAGDSLRIFIAEGTYKPLYDADGGRYQNDGGRDNAFVWVDRVHLYGGFPATGNPGMGQRNWKTHITTLSGDIGVANDYADNVYHVLIAVGMQIAHIDGVKITGGMADGTSIQTEIIINKTNLSFVRGAGGGIFFLGGGSSFTISNTEISGNRGEFGAGGSVAATPSLINLTVRDNVATERGGGFFLPAMGVGAGYVFTNALFTGNAAKYGAAICSQLDSLVLVNITMANNTASLGGNALFNWSSRRPVILTNSILWNSQPGAVSMLDGVGSTPFVVSHSIVQGAAVPVGTGNSNAAPLFTNAAGGNYTLQGGSPAVNAGSNQLYTDAGGDLNTDTDLAGNRRLAGGTIDMGAFENQTALPVLFGAIGAVVKNGELLVNWSTETETGNKHFLIQLSRDGSNWQTTQTVQTRAPGGNSSTPLDYETAIPLSALSLTFLFGVFALGCRRKYAVAIAAVVLFAVAFSCSRQAVIDDAQSGQLFVRIVQVDNNGTQVASKAIRVIQE